MKIGWWGKIADYSKEYNDIVMGQTFMCKQQ